MKLVFALALLVFLITISFADEPYFQQKVNYKIKVDLDPGTAKLSGTETIFYTNNSPDTLHEIYFHLYYNAFRPGSYLDLRSREDGDYGIALAPPRNIGFVNIDLLKVNGLKADTFCIDNTIMKVPLNVSLLLGDSLYFYIEFTSQVPAAGNRTAHDSIHFDVGQWYPKPAVYDRRGWHANQYYSETEFFADYADYDVEITLPANYIVAHCGTLLNESEIYGGRLPVPDGDSIIVDALKQIVKDSLRADAQAGIFPAESVPGISDSLMSGLPQSNHELKTWEIRAENIHDFAFSADPNFMVDICRSNETLIKTYYTKAVEDRWRRHAADYTRKTIKLYSDLYYPFPYRQYSVALSVVSGGMEYPDFCLISGKYGADNRYDTSLESTIAHEAGHAWFYGILGFDETEEAFLDEGLTSFATTQYLEHYYGRFKNNFIYEKWWQRRFLPNGNDRNDNQKRYIQKAISRTEDNLNTPAAFFKDGRTYYDASYYKASSVYFMLQYTLGDEGFDRFMKTLFRRWTFKHPYLSDVKAIAEEIYGGNLDWFFSQWFNTTWTLDYSLEKFKTQKRISDAIPTFETNVSVKRIGRCISPLDLTFYFKDGRTDTVPVPISAWLDNQIFFDTTLLFSAKPSQVVINPDLRLADVNRLNNSSGLPPVNYQFMIPKFIYPQNYIEYYTGSYTVAHNPTFWYNSIDGVSLGYAAKGSYLEILRMVQIQASLGLQSGKMNYSAEYDDVFQASHPQVSYYLGSKEWEGRGRQEIGLRYNPYDAEALNATQADLSLKRIYLYDARYLYGDGWSGGGVNTIEASLGQKLTQRYSSVVLQGALTSSFLGSDYNFRRLAGGLGVYVSAIGYGETRLLVKAGRSDGETPLQRRFYLSFADPYDTWDSPLYRSRGTLPDRWKNDGHLFKPGGAGLNGYVNLGASGTRMMSLKVTNDLPRMNLPVRIPYISKQVGRISSEVYFAGGCVWDDTLDVGFDDFLWEAGLHLSYPIPYLDRFIEENRLSLYLPLWLSNPPDGNKSIEWRWLISFTP